MPGKAFAAALCWKGCRSLGAIGATAIALTLSTTSLQNVVANGDTRTLSFFHTHSKESLTVTFKVNGRYDEAGLAKINHFLRDWRNHKVTKMNPHLFDILWEVNRDTGGKQPIQIISAYRSPETNEMLRSRSSGVAKHSQHTLGNAIDFRIPDVALAELRAAGLRLQRGGVGFYPGSDFVHMDTSSIRHWPRMTRDQLARVFPDGKTIHIPTDGVPLKNFQVAATEIQQRGQFGERTRTPVTTASVAPEANGLQRFITSIFSANSVANKTEQQEAEDETPAPQHQQTPPARTQVASASPQPILPAVARQQQEQRERLQWQTGPAPVNAPLEPSEETTGATTLAYANPRERNLPQPAQPQGTLTAVPLVAGAHQVSAGFAHANGPNEMKHPEQMRGFAAPVRAMVENRFEEFAPQQVAAVGFQRDRAPVNVVGFEPSRAASR
ncbi:MAG: DUF882 domain-containing protein [Rhizobiales bacterium]|nr:DUF882 domain-containing protein [Hyphomicrobiales bacterium]